jgi:predicted acylesterase/phospholipase RssA
MRLAKEGRVGDTRIDDRDGDGVGIGSEEAHGAAAPGAEAIHTDVAASGRSRQHVAVALSGGGHRASLFGLGALLYLVDAGKGPELATVSSISGGSITNGYVGMTTDLATVRADDFWRDVRPLARQVASLGTLFASPLTKAYLAVLGLVVIVAVVLTALWGAVLAWVAWPIALVMLGWLAQQRSWVAVQAFERTIFRGRRLESMSSAVDHVICATDLQTTEHVYFAGSFVYCYRAGWGIPGDLRLARAVQASSAMPGAFNAVRFPTSQHRFKRALPFRSFKLTDGGVYDNMGTEWPMRLNARLGEAMAPSGIHAADELVVVNASAALGVVRRRSLRVPLLGEITTLFAVKDVLYDQTTSVRRRLLDLRFRVTRRDPRSRQGGLAGTQVQIDRSPYQLADSLVRFSDALGERARRVIDHLGDDDGRRAEWARTAEANRSVTTALSKIPPDRAAALVRHAYVLTMANCHALLDYPLLPVPGPERFRELVT